MIVGNQSVFSPAKFPAKLTVMSSRIHMLSFDMIVEIGGFCDQTAVRALPLPSSQADHF